MRLVHGESDGLPGLVVDRYADTLVAQFLSSGAERWKETLADLLLELTGAVRLYERSDAEVRRLEGLDEAQRPAARRPAAGAPANSRERLEVLGGCSAWSQDRSLPGPAR